MTAGLWEQFIVVGLMVNIEPLLLLGIGAVLGYMVERRINGKP